MKKIVVGFQGEQDERIMAVVIRLKTKAVAVCRENRNLIQEMFREGTEVLFSKTW